MTRTRSGFTLLEMLVVVSILAVLGTGALLGYKRSAQSSYLQKVQRDLNAIDLAKVTWVQYHPQEAWPSDETERWNCCAPYIKQSAELGAAVTINGRPFHAFTGLAPKGYVYYIDDVSTPAQAYFGTTTPVYR